MASAKRTDTLHWLLAALIIALLVVAALQAWGVARAGTLHLPLDGREPRIRLSGAHAVEQDGARQFRWTTAVAEYRLDTPLAGPYLVAVRLGAPAPGLERAPLTLMIDPQRALRITPDVRPRAYYLLLPSDWGDGALGLRLETPAVTVAPDPRVVGVRLEGIAVRALGKNPAASLVAIDAALLILVILIARRLGATRRSQLLLLAACGAGIVGVTFGFPSLAITYFIRILATLGPLALLLVLALPAAERHASTWGIDRGFIHAASAITLVAIMIRLLGALFPLYEAHDLSLNVERYLRTIGGSLVASNRSFEFRSGVTIYPAGPYLLFAPALLLGLAPSLIVQGGNAIVDGIGALATIALSRTAGASRRASLLSGLLYAALPVMLTSLYWGHSAQVFGQGLMVPIALALLHGIRHARRASFAIAGALLACAFLSHIGVTILAIAWLGLAWIWMITRSRLGRATITQLTLALGCAGMVGLLLVYGPELTFKIEQTAAVSERVSSEGYASSILIWRALQISFYQIGLPLIPLGLWAYLRRLNLPPGGLALAGSWLAAALIFLGVELLTGLQVRYLVFLAPPACLLIADALDWIGERVRFGPLIAWGLALLLVAQGCASWYNGTINDIQMSMVPLLR
jgi:hypothetical protein